MKRFQYHSYKKWTAKILILSMFYSWILLFITPVANAAPPLTVTVNKNVTQGSPTNNKNVKYTVVFSDPIDTTTF
jgi:hypothetical protein